MTFQNAAAFTGVGLHTWKTGSVTSMYATFYGATSMNADVTGVYWYLRRWVLSLRHAYSFCIHAVL